MSRFSSAVGTRQSQRIESNPSLVPHYIHRLKVPSSARLAQCGAREHFLRAAHFSNVACRRNISARTHRLLTLPGLETDRCGKRISEEPHVRERAQEPKTW